MLRKNVIGQSALGIVVAAATLTLFGAGTSSAADIQTDYQVSGVAIRSAPNSTVLGQGYPGDGTSVVCGVWAPRAGEPGVDYWLLNRDKRTGVRGWSHSSGIAGTSSFVPKC